MRASLNETAQIEDYIFCRMSVQERQFFEVLLLTDSEFSSKVDGQRDTYALVSAYGRRQLKEELNAIHQSLFTSPGRWWFRWKIHRLFNKKT